jgi:hypothetical protein
MRASLPMIGHDDAVGRLRPALNKIREAKITRK